MACSGAISLKWACLATVMSWIMNTVLLQYISHSMFCYVWAVLFVWVLSDSMALSSDLKACEVQIQDLRIQLSHAVMHRGDVAEMHTILRGISKHVYGLRRHHTDDQLCRRPSQSL